LLGRLALRPLPQIEGAPLRAPAHGIDGGQIEGVARQPRAQARQARELLEILSVNAPLLLSRSRIRCATS
jgi:hypothetical protein